MLGGMRRTDIDHARGGIDEARRSRRATPPSWPAHGEPFPNGIGGAVSNGSGLVLNEGPAAVSAQQRATQALHAATPGLPQLEATGFLPAGVHRTSMAELTQRFAGNEIRAGLFGQLDATSRALAGAGVREAVVGGSLVSTKLHPGDVDVGIDVGGDAFRAAKQAVANLGPAAADVHLYPLGHLLTEAPQLPGKVPGWNVLEFFQHTRDGAARGVALLDVAGDAARILHR
ncbi:MAG: hypothetical protein JWN72_2256 [Thermoleophilia bacterium]|nr:hypothetical protein [Thermoleophilia bacterium]